MSRQADPIKLDNATFPWYLIWVLGANSLAVLNFTDFHRNGKVSSLLLAAAWLCWAFSWYAKPFRVNLRARISQAVAAQPLRAWVSQSVWNFTTLGAVALLIVGVALKLTNAA